MKWFGARQRKFADNVPLGVFGSKQAMSDFFKKCNARHDAENGFWGDSDYFSDVSRRLGDRFANLGNSGWPINWGPIKLEYAMKGA